MCFKQVSSTFIKYALKVTCWYNGSQGLILHGHTANKTWHSNNENFKQVQFHSGQKNY